MFLKRNFEIASIKVFPGSDRAPTLGLGWGASPNVSIPKNEIYSELMLSFNKPNSLLQLNEVWK